MAQFIPDEHYKGIRDTKSECPLAFITPYGTDKAAINRMATVDGWAGITAHDKIKKHEIIKNVPMTGFKIGDKVSRLVTSNVVWRITDPREFQLEISSGNMAYILAETAINKGLIDAELVWVRNGKDNFLLPVGSAEHAKYLLNTTALTAKLGVRDINIGDHIHDTKGTDGIFLGGYHFLIFQYYTYSNEEDSKLLRTKRQFAILDSKTNKIVLKNGFDGLSIIKAGAQENKDYVKFINDNKTDNFVYAFQKKPNILEYAKTARYKRVIGKTKATYLAQIDDGSVYRVTSGYNTADRWFDRLVIDSNTNSYYKNSIRVYGNTFHSMSTFGIGKKYKADAKIADLIDESSIRVKLIITVNDKDITIIQ